VSCALPRVAPSDVRCARGASKMSADRADRRAGEKRARVQCRHAGAGADNRLFATRPRKLRASWSHTLAVLLFPARANDELNVAIDGWRWWQTAEARGLNAGVRAQRADVWLLSDSFPLESPLRLGMRAFWYRRLLTRQPAKASPSTAPGGSTSRPSSTPSSPSSATKWTSCSVWCGDGRARWCRACVRS